jgi:hypothetical protein
MHLGNENSSENRVRFSRARSWQLIERALERSRNPPQPQAQPTRAPTSPLPTVHPDQYGYFDKCRGFQMVVNSSCAVDVPWSFISLAGTVRPYK